MGNSIFVKDAAEIEELEEKISSAGRALALELVPICRRYLDKWNTGSERERLAKFLDQINDPEIGYHPLEPQRRISLARQVELTCQLHAVIGGTRLLMQTQPGEGECDITLEIDPENPGARKRMLLSLLKEDEEKEEDSEGANEATGDVEAGTAG